ncbi:4-hydroxy-tetrahydrodipicolinate synthase [Phosphitispora sp. TUW77]|uniref:4-hydroxy-tetrahydrodipicolinate synthase n=1 Tax=Phosphitispora sp. TUW77 TaxID=3152361 RepID=UPI003AB1373C
MVRDFGRVLTAMVTPFDSKMEVDYGQARKLARYLADNGSDGIVVAGTTGESPTLTREEKIRLFETIVDEVGNRVKVIAGTGSNITSDSVSLTMEAEKVGVDGAMLVTPYYNKPPQRGMYQHFRTVAKATNLPIMLYNVPGRTSSHLLPDTIAELAKIDNIIAVKEASGSLPLAGEIRQKTPEDFLLYCGEDAIILPMLSVGGYGVVSVVAHIVGNELQAMVKAFLEGDTDTARKIHLDLIPVFDGMFLTTNPIPVKTAMNLMGYDVGGLRPPLVSATDDETEAIRDLLKNYKKI